MKSIHTCAHREYAAFLAELRAHILVGAPKPSGQASGNSSSLNRHAWANRSGSDIASYDRLDDGAVAALAASSKEEPPAVQQQPQQALASAAEPANGEEAAAAGAGDPPKGVGSEACAPSKCPMRRVLSRDQTDLPLLLTFSIRLAASVRRITAA